jgi:uncharacterized protein (DUF4415 family)
MGSDYVDNLIDDDEIPELTQTDFERSLPFSQLPLDLQNKLLAINGEGAVHLRREQEEQIAVPVSRSVVERFQASGSGWEERVDEALREWLDKHPAS